jgi:hypothetical protein
VGKPLPNGPDILGNNSLYLAEKTIEVRDLLSVYQTFRVGGAKKNKGKERKTRKRRSVE